jgi:hypothetical protein
MKKIFLTVVVIGIFCGSAFSQTTPKFNLTKDGIKPIVLTFDASISINQIYTKSKSWNASMAKYPISAIRINKENVQVKHGGYVEKAWKITDNKFEHWYPMEYTLNVEIKEGKCRVTFDTPETGYKVWFNADGTILKKFKDSKATFELTVNTLLTSLYNYIKSTPKKAEDNW